MSVRVRIAPSPTGDPHVGTAYIGLLNWCFARRHGGRFVLRLEDTDQERCQPKSAQAIIEALRWLGLAYDEGPDIGGPHGPYVQSERHRLGIYRRYAEQLLAQGDAYPCFCSTERLASVRAAQLAARQPVMYDRHCRELAPAEARARIAAGEPHVIRLKVPTSGEFSYRDRLRPKPFTKRWEEIDDQVLLKADGWPTYHLAAVVDDHLMGITHVIRAEEWLNSLPKHLLLNERLGFTPPEYIHVGLLRNADKSKISKRKNPTSLLWYRAQGYLPEALLNFLALLGHSHPEGREQFTIAELAEVFDIERVHVTGPVFDLKKLDHLQGLWFRQLPAERVRAEVHAAIDARFDALYPLLRERMTRGGDFLHWAEPFYSAALTVRREDLVPAGQDASAVRGLLEAMAGTCAALQAEERWTASDIEAAIRSLCEQRAAADPAQAPLCAPKLAFGILRQATLGRPHSPPLFPCLEVLGAVRTRERLAAAIQALR
ncbi:MAG: glutamate--tRNA ligase [Planctomycetota bacterium]|nr:glutamate--tRNA ligase [Planctomycetota bacterium]MCX8040747.1 glutamate--tRNA ligase [Planctomycetota bacterium]MDW8373731.1 glutamate--tRNA ligase [Planctomycetota bacterium]